MDLSNICLGCFKPRGAYDVCMHCGFKAGTAPEQAFHLHPGMVLNDRYLIGSVIGFGGFGITYKTWDISLESVTAIKEFFPSGLVSRIPGEAQVVVFSGEKEELYRHQLARFMEEARNMAKFDDSPQIVNVFDYFEANNTAYIVMEFLDGVTLKDYARDAAKNPVPLSLDIAMMVLEPMTHALEQMHMRGIIHRDVSPDNIFITKNGAVKLLDFGAARLSAEGHDETLMAIIKPGYAPPEQYRSKSRQGPYTDVYGLGATLYRMLTGLTPDESIDRQIDDMLALPSKIGIQLEPRLEKSLMKSMALKQELRFQSMREFREAVFANRKVDYPEEELKKRQRTRAIVVLASVAAMLTVVFSVGYALSKPKILLTALEIEPCTISAFYPADIITNYESAAHPLITGFNGTYPQIGVEFSATPLDSYSAKLRTMYAAAEPPDLFYSSVPSLELNTAAEPLNLLVDSLNSRNYLFMDNYKNAYPEMLEMPTAFDISVIYANPEAAKYYEKNLPASVKTASDLTGIERWAVDYNSYGDYAALYAGGLAGSASKKYSRAADGVSAMLGIRSFLPDIASDPLDALESENVICLLGRASGIRRVQESLPGYYSVIPAYNSDGLLYGTFSDEWAVSRMSDDNAKNAAMLFLTHMMSNYIQDMLYVQNDSGIPVNRAAFDEYIKINPDFNFMRGATSKIKFISDTNISAFGEELRDYMLSGNAGQSELDKILKKYDFAR